MQYLLTPIRTVVEAAKGLGNIFKDIFTGNWSQIKQDAETAFGGIKDAFTKGFDFKGNFAAGKEAGQAFVDGLLTMKPKAKKAGKDIGQALREGIESELDKMDEEIDKAFDKTFADWEKKQEERNKIAEANEKRRLDAINREAEVGKRVNGILIEDAKDLAEAQYQTQLEANEKRLAALRQFADDAIARGDIDKWLEYEQQAADLSVDIELDRAEREKAIREQEAEEAKAMAEARVTTLQGVANATASILGSIADMYEADAEGSTAAARKVKGLRIAEATINTISGAVGAYTQAAATIPPPYGIILGAVQAATAAGLANIAKIRATQVGGGGASSAPTVSAPRVDVGPQQTTVIQGDQAEERLNRMAADQRVYILQSDIEAAGHTSKVQVAEASF